MSFSNWKLEIKSPSLAYADKVSARQVIMAVAVPYPLLRAWYKYMAEVQKRKTSRRRQQVTLVAIFLTAHAIMTVPGLLR